MYYFYYPQNLIYHKRL